MSLFSKKTEDTVTLPEIIGLPPEAAGSDHLNFKCEANDIEYDGMPIVDLMAMEPAAQWASSFFTFRSAMSKNESNSNDATDPDEITPSYNGMLLKYGYKLAGDNPQYIRCAFLGDAQITETLTNNYEESFLEDLTSGFSKVSQVAQLVGGSSIGQLYNSISGAINADRSGNQSPDAVQNAVSDASQIAGVFKDLAATDSHLGALAASTSKMIGMTAKKMAGARADFPKLWSGSTYEPTHSLTIRLYNPWPGSERATRYFINGPITALMLLATPRTTDGILYNWPFLVRARASGMFNIPIGYISNITIVRGGDNNQIGLNQISQIVDVKLEISSIYSSMVAFHDPRSQKAIQMKATSFRPMLDGFVRTFDNQKVLQNAAFYGHPGDWTVFWSSPAGQMIINKVYYDTGIANVVHAGHKVIGAVKDVYGEVKDIASHPVLSAVEGGIAMYHAIGDIGKGACGLIDDYVIDPAVSAGQEIASNMAKNHNYDADISHYYDSTADVEAVIKKNLSNVGGPAGTNTAVAEKFKNEPQKTGATRYINKDGSIKPEYATVLDPLYMKAFCSHGEGNCASAALRLGQSLAQQRSTAENYFRNRTNGSWDQTKLLNDKNSTNSQNGGTGRKITASWYGKQQSATQVTSSGDKFNENDLTVASLQLPPHTRVQLTSDVTGRSVVVSSNDSGPYFAGREMDMSAATAKALGVQNLGVSSVRMKILSYQFEGNNQKRTGSTTATTRPTVSKKS